MINKLIYTYWTNNGENLLVGFHSEDSFIKIFRESLENSKKFFEEVIIYTDIQGKDYLKSLDIESIYIIIDYTIYDFNKEFWNFPKLISMNLQDEPFIHIDMDLILHEKPKNLGEKIICEKIRGLVMLSRELIFLPKFIQNNYNPNNICSGILGGDHLIFKQLFDISSEVVKIKKTNISFNMIFAIEEIILTSLCNIKKITPSVIDAEFTHYQSSNSKLELLFDDLDVNDYL